MAKLSLGSADWDAKADALGILTPAQRILKRLKIEALQKVKAVFENSISKRFICHELDALIDREPKYGEAASDLFEYIDDALGRHAYLEGWQEYNWSLLLGRNASNDPIQDRILWIEWMIQCLEEDLNA